MTVVFCVSVWNRVQTKTVICEIDQDKKKKGRLKNGFIKYGNSHASKKESIDTRQIKYTQNNMLDNNRKAVGEISAEGPPDI